MKDTDIIAAIAPDAVSLMDKAIAEIKRLRQENATLTAERDAARREVCTWASRLLLDHDQAFNRCTGKSQCDPLPANSCIDTASLQIASQRGWDCFKDKRND